MNELKDTHYKNAKRCIRRALEEDITEYIKEQLIKYYNELTENNSKNTLLRVELLMEPYYQEQIRKRRKENESFQRDWFRAFILLYLFVVFIASIYWHYVPEFSNVSIYDISYFLSSAGVIFLILSLIPRIP